LAPGGAPRPRRPAARRPPFVFLKRSVIADVVDIDIGPKAGSTLNPDLNKTKLMAYKKTQTSVSHVFSHEERKCSIEPLLHIAATGSVTM
jgi:hypothetical protein